MFTLNCKGKLYTAESPLVMGILNATPDSFFEGHLRKGVEAMTTLASRMIAEGADILDIGGQSTRPASRRIGVEEEMKRVLPLIENIHCRYPEVLLSIDTYHSRVAHEAVDAGASIVNDISGGTMDEQMLATVASLHVPYICMHMQGTPETMQQAPHYEHIITDITRYFVHRIAACKEAGIHDIILDPGFGFGKTIAHNFELLRQFSAFKILGKPLLAGISRKSFLYKTAGVAPSEALTSTIAGNMAALLQGASILRVHDVKEAREIIQLYKHIKNAG